MASHGRIVPRMFVWTWAASSAAISSVIAPSSVRNLAIIWDSMWSGVVLLRQKFNGSEENFSRFSQTVKTRGKRFRPTFLALGKIQERKSAVKTPQKTMYGTRASDWRNTGWGSLTFSALPALPLHPSSGKREIINLVNPLRWTRHKLEKIKSQWFDFSLLFPFFVFVLCSGASKLEKEGGRLRG